jgi:hypothetical protein
MNVGFALKSQPASLIIAYHQFIVEQRGKKCVNYWIWDDNEFEFLMTLFLCCIDFTHKKVFSAWIKIRYGITKCKSVKISIFSLFANNFLCLNNDHFILYLTKFQTSMIKNISTYKNFKTFIEFSIFIIYPTKSIMCSINYIQFVIFLYVLLRKRRGKTVKKERNIKHENPKFEPTKTLNE